jgi:hypothetical protein
MFSRPNGQRVERILAVAVVGQREREVLEDRSQRAGVARRRRQLRQRTGPGLRDLPLGSLALRAGGLDLFADGHRAPTASPSDSGSGAGRQHRGSWWHLGRLRGRRATGSQTSSSMEAPGQHAADCRTYQHGRTSIG